MMDGLTIFHQFIENNRQFLGADKLRSIQTALKKQMIQVFHEDLASFHLAQDDVLIPSEAWISQATIDELHQYIATLRKIDEQVQTIFQKKLPLDQLTYKSSIYEKGKLNLVNLDQLILLSEAIKQLTMANHSNLISRENVQSFLKQHRPIHLLRPCVTKRLRVEDLPLANTFLTKADIAQIEDIAHIKDKIIKKISKKLIYVSEQMVHHVAQELSYQMLTRYRLSEAILTIAVPILFAFAFALLTFVRIRSSIFNPNDQGLVLIFRLILAAFVPSLGLTAFLMMTQNRASLRNNRLTHQIMSVVYTGLFVFIFQFIDPPNLLWQTLLFGLTLYGLSMFTFSLRSKNHYYFHLSFQGLLGLWMMYFFVVYPFFDNLLMMLVTLPTLYGLNKFLKRYR
jgi:hypothetical protein